MLAINKSKLTHNQLTMPKWPDSKAWSYLSRAWMQWVCIGMHVATASPRDLTHVNPAPHMVWQNILNYEKVNDIFKQIELTFTFPPMNFCVHSWPSFQWLIDYYLNRCYVIFIGKIWVNTDQSISNYFTILTVLHLFHGYPIFRDYKSRAIQYKIHNYFF